MKALVLILCLSLSSLVQAAKAKRPAAPVVKDEATATAEGATPTAEVEAMIAPVDTPTEEPTPTLQELNERLKKVEQLAKAIKLEGYAQIRYDNQRYKVGSFVPLESGPDPVISTFNSQPGVYIKRFELKLSGPLTENVDWVGGYGFEEGKLKDLGLIWKGLPFFPGLRKRGYAWEAQIGQFRQKFGIEPQTGSPKIPFIERALMFGGANPLSPTALKQVGERALGLHGVHKKDFESWGYDAGFSLVGDVADQAKGSNSLAGAFPLEPTNGRPVWVAHLGLSLKQLYKWAGPLKVGGSALRNDLGIHNAALSTEDYAATLGLEAYFEPVKEWVWLQAEWINTQLNPATGRGYANGFYVEGGFKAPKVKDFGNASVELSGRYEKVSPPSLGFPQNVSALTGQLKLGYAKNSHTAASVTYYAPEDHVEQAHDLVFYSVQQQFTY